MFSLWNQHLFSTALLVEVISEDIAQHILLFYLVSITRLVILLCISSMCSVLNSRICALFQSIEKNTMDKETTCHALIFLSFPSCPLYSTVRKVWILIQKWLSSHRIIPWNLLVGYGNVTPDVITKMEYLMTAFLVPDHPNFNAEFIKTYM